MTEENQFDEKQLHSITADHKDNNFEGIFFSMSQILNNKNPANLNIIKIIPSDTINVNYTHVIEKGYKSHWFSFRSNPWLKFDFNNIKVKISGYSLKTYSGGENYAHLKSWDLEASNDDQNWISLHSMRHTTDINSDSAEMYYDVVSDTFYIYLRIKMIGPSWAGSDFMVIRNFEIFGSTQ